MKVGFISFFSHTGINMTIIFFAALLNALHSKIENVRDRHIVGAQEGGNDCNHGCEV